ncbi:MAG TPA: glycoside hydrolase family 5 protein [Pirellulales bacterium]|jgi:endoglucanase|nr:glycoside hydrolase family 5 protein [Pirellulales bacterium]
MFLARRLRLVIGTSAVRWALLAVALLAEHAAADDKVPAPRVVVDFGAPQAFTLHAEQAETAMVPSKSGLRLQITTDAKASWPGVNIFPRAGNWDLSGFDRVEMGVVNPQDVPVRVLLNIDNPGSDGRQHCNAASVTVAPQQHAMLVVPFGTWHGDSTHPLDQKNIVSLKVLLDQPGRGHRFLVENIRALPFDRSAMRQVFADPFYEQLRPPFGRGIDLGNMLDAPREGAWGVILKPEYFGIIKKAGFDSVRLPVRWPAHADDAAPYTIDAAFFSRVDAAVRQALDQQLQVVLDMHYYDELMEQPADHRARFLGLWRQLAEHYRDYPGEVAFELLNEPMKKITAEFWNALVADTLAEIRPSNPDRQIVVGPIGWNSIHELPGLELPEQDRHLIVTIHYYEPFHFTHQGADWIGRESREWLGTKWLGTPAEQRAVQRDFDTAITWAVEHRRPLYLGEFGAFERADLESRARWTRYVAEQAVARKMGFGYWEFCAGFGAYDPRQQAWIEPLKAALLPH